MTKERKFLVHAAHYSPFLDSERPPLIVTETRKEKMVKGKQGVMERLEKISKHEGCFAIIQEIHD